MNKNLQLSVLSRQSAEEEGCVRDKRQHDSEGDPLPLRIRATGKRADSDRNPDYLWNPDRSPLAQIEGSSLGNSQEQLLYLHADHLLTPRRAMNTVGASV